MLYITHVQYNWYNMVMYLLSLTRFIFSCTCTEINL